MTFFRYRTWTWFLKAPYSFSFHSTLTSHPFPWRQPPMTHPSTLLNLPFQIKVILVRETDTAGPANSFRKHKKIAISGEAGHCVKSSMVALYGLDWLIGTRPHASFPHPNPILSPAPHLKFPGPHKRIIIEISGSGTCISNRHILRNEETDPCPFDVTRLQYPLPYWDKALLLSFSLSHTDTHTLLSLYSFSHSLHPLLSFSPPPPSQSLSFTHTHT